METTTIKINKYIVEKLREQYTNMSMNEIFECIASEEEYLGRPCRSFYGIGAIFKQRYIEQNYLQKIKNQLL